MSGPLNAAANVGATKEEVDTFRTLTGLGMGTVLLHSLLPSSISHKVEVSAAQMFKVASFIKKLGATEGEQKKRPPLVSTIPENPKMDKLASHLDTPTIRMGEMPSANGGASARGLARVAACVVGGGELDGVRIMSEEAVGKMQAKPTAAKDVGILGVVTQMTQGGLGLYR